MGIEQMIKFWWRSGPRIRIRMWIPIATLALVEVCTVALLLVL